MRDKSERIKEIINEAIEESDIKKIISVLLETQTNDLLNKINEQNQNLIQQDVIKEQINELNKKIISLQAEKDIIENNMKEISGKLEYTQHILSETKKMHEPYKSFDDAYDMFQKLSSETKQRLSNIFENHEIGGFIAAGMQWENIEGIWNFIRRKVIENENYDLIELHNIFLFFFEKYNQQKDVATYRLINPNRGMQYDSDKHVIIGTKTDGIIKEVALEGIENVKTKRIINKALIKV